MIEHGGGGGGFVSRPNLPLTDDLFSNDMYAKYGDGAQRDWLDDSALIMDLQNRMEMWYASRPEYGTPFWQNGRYDRDTMRALAFMLQKQGYSGSRMTMVMYKSLDISCTALHDVVTGIIIGTPNEPTKPNKFWRGIRAIAVGYLAYVVTLETLNKMDRNKSRRKGRKRGRR